MTLNTVCDPPIVPQREGKSFLFPKSLPAAPPNPPASPGDFSAYCGSPLQTRKKHPGGSFRPGVGFGGWPPGSKAASAPPFAGFTALLALCCGKSGGALPPPAGQPGRSTQPAGPYPFCRAKNRRRVSSPAVRWFRSLPQQNRLFSVVLSNKWIIWLGMVN